MPTITIERPFEWCNQAFINIYINDEKMGEINSGKTIDFEVPPGTHKVAVKKKQAGLNRPIMVDVSSDEKRIIKVSSLKYGRILTPVLLLVLFGIYQLAISFIDFEKYFIGVIAVYAVVVFFFMYFNSKYFYYKMEEVE